MTCNHNNRIDGQHSCPECDQDRDNAFNVRIEKLNKEHEDKMKVQKSSCIPLLDSAVEMVEDFDGEKSEFISTKEFAAKHPKAVFDNSSNCVRFEIGHNWSLEWK